MYYSKQISMSRAEQDKSGATGSKPPAPVLTSPLSTGPLPPLTSMSPILYMPPTPSATHSVTVPGSLHSNPVGMQTHQPIPAVSPPTFPFSKQIHLHIST